MIAIIENPAEGEVIVRVNGKLAGRVRRRVYITRRKPEHYFRKFNGFGISKKILDELNQMGVDKILIIYTNQDGSETLLRSDIYQWLFNGTEWIDTSNGFQDEQLVLSVLEMDIEGATPDFWRSSTSY